jgi:hypothetical protein
MSNLSTILTAMLSGKGTLMVSLITDTNDVPAAAHKGTVLNKKCSMTSMVFREIKDHDLYRKMVTRSAEKIEGNDLTKVQEFVPGEAWFVHDMPVFSLVSGKKNPDKKYLYHVPLRTHSVQYLVNGQVVRKEEYAQYLTPSKAKDLLATGPKQHKTGGFKHGVVLRTVSLENITRFKTRGITLTQ